MHLTIISVSKYWKPLHSIPRNPEQTENACGLKQNRIPQESNHLEENPPKQETPSKNNNVYLTEHTTHNHLTGGDSKTL